MFVFLHYLSKLHLTYGACSTDKVSWLNFVRAVHKVSLSRIITKVSNWSQNLEISELQDFTAFADSNCRTGWRNLLDCFDKLQPVYCVCPTTQCNRLSICLLCQIFLFQNLSITAAFADSSCRTGWRNLLDCFDKLQPAHCVCPTTQCNRLSICLLCQIFMLHNR